MISIETNNRRIPKIIHNKNRNSMRYLLHKYIILYIIYILYLFIFVFKLHNFIYYLYSIFIHICIQTT